MFKLPRTLGGELQGNPSHRNRNGKLVPRDNVSFLWKNDEKIITNLVKKKKKKSPQVWHSNRTGSASKVCSLGSARNWETWIIFEKVKRHVNNQTYSFIKPAFVEKCLRPVFNVIAVQTLYSWGEKLCLCIRDEPNNAWKTEFRTEGAVLLAFIWISSHLYLLFIFVLILYCALLSNVCMYLFV